MIDSAFDVLPHLFWSNVLLQLSFSDIMTLIRTSRSLKLAALEHLSCQPMHLDLTLSGKAVNAALQSTGTLCGHIESLTLHGATHLRQSCEREGEHALEKCLRQHMRVLHLEGVPKRGLGAWFLPALSTKCRQLVELDLAGCAASIGQDKGDGWSELPRTLQKVVLRDNKELSGGAVRALSALPQLAHVDIGLSVCHGVPSHTCSERISDEDVAVLVSSCGTRLSHLSVALRSKVADGTAGALSRLCPNITHLDISNTIVSPQGVTAVAAACRQLRVLRCGALVHGASLDDDQLAVVASGSAEEGGTSIANEQMGLWDASNSFNSSSERVHQQQGALSSGQSTRGGGSGSGAEQPTRPSHAWQMSLVTKVSQLQLLDLGLHSGYTDVGLATLAYGCPQLRQVHLSRNARITPQGVAALLSSCPHMTLLRVVRCRHVGAAAAKRLRQQFSSTTGHALTIDLVPMDV